MDKWRGGGQFQLNKGLSYKDWVWLLSGRGVNGRSIGSGQYLRGCMLYYPSTTASDRTNYRVQGATFGTPAGPNGRPLCEVKPLDDLFFYYSGYQRMVYGGNANSVNASQIYLHAYLDNSWTSTYAGLRIYGKSVTYNDIWTSGREIELEPGVYIFGGLTNPINAGTIGIQFYIDNKLSFATTSNTTNVWIHNTRIFFVDSPVTFWIYYSYTSNRNSWIGRLCRITPPGYWE